MARKIAIPCSTPYSIRWRTRQLAQMKSPSVINAPSSTAPASADMNVFRPSDSVIQPPKRQSGRSCSFGSGSQKLATTPMT